MSDTISLPRITIHTDQVHIHIHAAPPPPPSSTPTMPMISQLHRSDELVVPSNDRRSLFGRIMGRSAHAASSPQLEGSTPSPVQQPRSSSLYNIPTGNNMNATPSPDAAANSSAALNRPSNVPTSPPTSNEEALRDAAVALSSALNQGGFLTLGETVIRLNSNNSPSASISMGAPTSPSVDGTDTRRAAAAAPTTSALSRKSRKNPKSSELPEHRFWLKGDMYEPLIELQRNQLYDAGTIVHHTRLAMLVHEAVHQRQTLPLYIGLGLPQQSIAYTEQELRNLFRQVCLAVQILHNPATGSSPLRRGSGGDDTQSGYFTFPTAHRNLHLNHILVDPVTGRVSLRGFQHAVRLEQTADPPRSQDSRPSYDTSGGGQEEQKVGSFISTMTDVFGDDTASAGDTPRYYYSTAPLIFDESDATRGVSSPTSPTSGSDDAATLARRLRRRLKRRAYDWFAFRAPELHVDGAPHGTAVDIWSLGAALYVLLTGLPPFRGNGESLTKAKLDARIAPYDVTTEPTAAVQDLIRRMLVVDPRERFDIAQVLSHEWLADESDAAVAAAMSCDLTLAQTCLQDWGRRSKK